jgi:hypothetical protein
MRNTILALTIAAAGAIAPAAVCAQDAELRLSDIFTTTTVTATKPTPTPTPVPTTQLKEDIGSLERALAAGDTVRVIAGTEYLLQVVAKADPIWANALHLRAQAFEKTGDAEQVRLLGAEYLRLDAKGEHARWFLAQIAKQAASRKEWSRAADAWKQAIAAPGGDLAAQDALAAAASFGQAGRAEDVRAVLLPLDWNRLANEDRTTTEVWLLDSLLVADDENFPLPYPPSPSAGAVLRRALLADLRGDNRAARSGYDDARRRAAELTPAERAAIPAAKP